MITPGGFILSSPAAADLRDILAYIADKSGPERADQVAARFRAMFTKLAGHPGLGHRRPDLTPSPVRFAALWSYLIIYKPGTEPLEIARVVHGARDVESLLSHEPL